MGTEQKTATPQEIALQKTTELFKKSKLDKPLLSTYDQEQAFQEGEGFLMSADTNVLHLAIVNGVSEENRSLINCAVEFTKEIHKKKREDGYTPEVNHILRTALRGIMRDPNMSVEQLLVRLFHDAEEDYPKIINNESFKEHFRTKLGADEYRDLMLDHVYIAIHGMNKNREELGPQEMGKDEREREYLDNLIHLDQQYPELGMIEAKVDDTIDSFYGDNAKLLTILAGYQTYESTAINRKDKITIDEQDDESKETVTVSSKYDETEIVEQKVASSMQRIKKSAKKVQQRMRITDVQTLLNDMEAAILVGEQLTQIDAPKKGEIIIVEFKKTENSTLLRNIA